MLAVAIFARYSRHLAGHLRWIYVVAAVIALYFNVFVLVVQTFEKIPALHAMAPTQTKPPFKLTQFVVLAIFVLLGIVGQSDFAPNQSLRLDRSRLLAASKRVASVQQVLQE